MKKSYKSTFTPLNEEELPKKCNKCNKELPASSFRMLKCKRNGIIGVSRNMNCRNCESGKKDNDIDKEKLNENFKILNSLINKNILKINELENRINILEKKEMNNLIKI